MITTRTRLEARSCILSECLKEQRQRVARTDARCDAIKSGGTPAVAMHFDAVIIRRVTYASFPLYLSFFLPRPFCLSGIFKRILRRGSSRFLPVDSTMRGKKRRGFSPPLLNEKGEDNVSEKHSTATQMYSVVERFLKNPIS